MIVKRSAEMRNRQLEMLPKEEASSVLSRFFFLVRVVFTLARPAFCRVLRRVLRRVPSSRSSARVVFTGQGGVTCIAFLFVRVKSISISIGIDINIDRSIDRSIDLAHHAHSSTSI